MSYIFVKHLHVAAAALSILFFIVRACWSVAGSPRLQSRFVRIAPHVIDTVLLVCGFILASMIGPQQPWILAKIIGLVCYVIVGTVAIKRGRTPAARAVAAIVAAAIFAYIVGVAITKQPLSWFA